MIKTGRDIEDNQFKPPYRPYLRRSLLWQALGWPFPVLFAVQGKDLTIGIGLNIYEPDITLLCIFLCLRKILFYTL